MAPIERVTDGVYRLGTDWVGCYLIVADGEAGIVDCGFPGYFDLITQALAELELSPDALVAIVLTHHHPDHVGSAERLRRETRATVYAPAGEAEAVRTGKGSLPPGFISSLWRPRMVRYMAHAGRHGGRSVEPVREVRTYADGEVLDVPGGLRAVATPGHTAGHCSLLAERAGVLFAGDALATVSHLTGERGPRVMPFNESADQARSSLSRLEELPARLVVVGHGDVFRGTPAEAASAARLNS